MNKPKLIVPTRWIHEYVAEVMRHPDEETGRGIYGIVMEDKTVFVLGLLVPTNPDIQRSHAHVRIGGGDMGKTVGWLEKNWKWAQRHTSSNVNGHFTFLSSAHSHHGLGVGSFSPRDKQSMLEYVRDEHLPVAVAVLATIERNKFSIIPAFFNQPGVIGIDRRWNIKLKFYYLDEEMKEQGITEPILITPTIVDVKDVPPTPPLGWQFANVAEFDEQLRHLKNLGCTVGINHREYKPKEPLYIQFVIGHPLWAGILNILTPWDYPEHEPVIEVLPLTNREHVPSEFEASELLKTGPLWKPGDDFIEVIMRLRARGEL